MTTAANGTNGAKDEKKAPGKGALLAGGPVKVTTDRLVEQKVPGGLVVVNETTGAIHFEDAEGNRTPIREAAPPPPPPEAPRAIPGKLVAGEDGKRRFVPDDEADGAAFDVTKAIAERDEEGRLSPLRKRTREIEEKRERELREVESLATDADKIEGLSQLVDRLQKENAAIAGINARYEVTILGQSILLARAQFPNQ